MKSTTFKGVFLMDIYMGFIVAFLFLIFGVIKNIFIGYMLMICWGIFALIALRRGKNFKDILDMSYKGSKQAFVVLQIFLIIGAVIGSWLCSGTIPTMVVYCLEYVKPHLFVIAAFGMSCLTSFLIGTSFGTASVVGIPLMIMARSGSINLNIVAGAIISGIYFGDRCSPMSSSAALTANLTHTDIFENIKNMIKTSLIPFTIAIGFYYFLSITHPLNILDNSIMIEIKNTFDIRWIMLIPAAIILVLSLCKVKIKVSMIISVVAAAILAVIYQGYSLQDIFKFIFVGFKLEDNTLLQGVIKGGGVVSMLKAAIVVFISCAMSGILNGINALDKLKKKLLDMKLQGAKLFGATAVMSMATGSFGCNQSISVVLINDIMSDCYSDNYRLALDIENSAILTAALIPWNIAAFFPTTALGVNPIGYLPYAIYLYTLPVIYFFTYKFFKVKKENCSGIKEEVQNI